MSPQYRQSRSCIRRWHSEGDRRARPSCMGSSEGGGAESLAGLQDGEPGALEPGPAEGAGLRVRLARPLLRSRRRLSSLIARAINCSREVESSREASSSFNSNSWRTKSLMQAHPIHILQPKYEIQQKSWLRTQTLVLTKIAGSWPLVPLRGDQKLCEAP